MRKKVKLAFIENDSARKATFKKRKEQSKKALEQLRKQKKDNREMEVTHAMFHGLTGQSLIYLNMLDLTDLGWIIDQNMIEIIMRIQTLTVNNSYAGAASVAVVETWVAEGGAEGTVVVAEPPVTVGFDVNGESVQRQPWTFTDLVNPPNQFQFGGGPVTGGGEEMLLPFSDQNQDNLWSFRNGGI